MSHHPGRRLFATVALPSLVAAVLAHRRDRRAPTAVLVAAAMLLIELVVQIPFIGLSWLQLGFGTVGLGMAVAAARARNRGW